MVIIILVVELMETDDECECDAWQQCETVSPCTHISMEAMFTRLTLFLLAKAAKLKGVN